MTKKEQWMAMSTGQRVAAIALGAVQIALAVSAWADLARRPRELVRGSKAKWAVIIGIEFIGPIAYFTRGRLHRELN